MNIILFDGTFREKLLPLTFTRPVAHIRVGALTIIEKWQMFFNNGCTVFSQKYLLPKYPLSIQAGLENIWIQASVCPNGLLYEAIKNLKPKQEIYDSSGILIAINSGMEVLSPEQLIEGVDRGYSKFIFDGNYTHIKSCPDIFLMNDIEIRSDVGLLTLGRHTQPLPKGNQYIQPENIFIESGVNINGAILNASTGPIYIGKDAEIMEGALIRGPFVLGEHATLKMGAKVYGATTIGPHSKVGGELSNSVILGFSNKAHDGFLGNSIIGEWCNLGADTNNSNLKNNYAEVKLWDYSSKRFINTGLVFCGLVMGDHSKSAINTMFNTGTVVGIFANIFGAGFPRNFIPDFTWGGPQGITVYKLADAFEVAQKVMGRRGLTLTEEDKSILSDVFSQTVGLRNNI